MSDVLFKCSGCSLNLAVSETFAGMSFACTSCKAPLRAPEPILRFLCPSCSSDLSAPYEMRDEVVACPNCEAGLRIPPKLTLPCPSCNVNLEVEDEYYRQLAGTAVECPECGGQVFIPGSAAVPVVEPEKVEEAKPVEPRKADSEKSMAQFEPGFAQRTMRLDEFMEDISQANTLKEGRCPYCNTPLLRLHDRAFVCKRCNRVIKTVKRTIH